MRKSIATAAALAVILAAAAAAFAAAPGRITYQGTLRKDGRLFSGTAAMVFRITDASLSVEYWTSGSTDVFVSTGLFRYPLGTPNEAAFDAIPWKDITPYVQVSLEGGWLPAEPLYSSVYSFHSVTSESSTGTFTVNGGDLVIDGAATHGIIFSDGTSQYAAPGWKAAVSGTQTSFGGSAALGRSSAGTRLDVQGAAADDYVQIWRDSSGLITSSMTASGVLYADASRMRNMPSGADGLGGHTASQALDMAGFPINAAGGVTSSGQITAASSVTVLSPLGLVSHRVELAPGVEVSSETSPALGGGVRVSSNIYIVGFSSAARYYGDGSQLTGITAGMTGIESDPDQFSGDGESVGTRLALRSSSVTLRGNAFNAANQLVLLDGAGSLAVGSGASVSTLSAAGFLGLASLTGQPSGAGAGALYYNSQAFDGAGALYVNLNGDFVPLATGTVAGGGGGFSGVISDGDQFSGDGAGTSLTLRASSVTLQGNTFNVANRLVLLDGDGKLPAIDGSRLTGIEGGGGGSGTCTNPGNPDDIMVQVGDYCVDKYEATVWSSVLADGTQYGASADDYPCSDDGSTCLPAGTPIYALSLPGFVPSSSITWFQASAACANSGKHLITNAEWQAAVVGTPTGGYGSPPNCNVGLEDPTTTGGGTSCLSAWGVENMVGSLWEMVAEWEEGDTETVMRVRGGAFDSPGEAGPTVMTADNTPTDFDSVIGFRCAMNLR